MDSQKRIEFLNIATQEYLSGRKLNISAKSIAEKYGFTKQQLYSHFKILNIDSSRQKTYDENIFEKIDTEEKAYWLGFLYADGCVYKPNYDSYIVSLELAIIDYSHLEKFKTFLGGFDKINTRIRKKYEYCSYSIRGKKIGEDLIKLGCVPKKSLILEFPTEDQVPTTLIHHFIRGYFDGDGCISITSKTKTINTSVIGTREFLSGICQFFNIPTDRIKLARKDSINEYFIICFLVEERNKLVNSMYKDSKIYLERKYKLYEKIVFEIARLNNKKLSKSRMKIKAESKSSKDYKSKLYNIETGEIFSSIKEVEKIDQNFKKGQLYNKHKKPKYDYYLD